MVKTLSVQFLQRAQSRPVSTFAQNLKLFLVQRHCDNAFALSFEPMSHFACPPTCGGHTLVGGEVAITKVLGERTLVLGQFVFL